MSLPRFYHPELPASITAGIQPTIQLSSSESQHATHVLRLASGDYLEVFDGRGNVAQCSLESCSKKAAVVRMETLRFEPRDVSPGLVLAVALPKGDRQRSVIEQAMELGVTQIIAVRTKRSVAEPNDKAIERLQRYCIESAKQCGRNRLPTIDRSESVSHFIDVGLPHAFAEAFPNSHAVQASHLWIAHPYIGLQQDRIMHANQPAQTSMTSVSACNKPVVVFIGPEGGFTDDEVALAIANDWQLLQMGPRILRVETAVAKALTIANELLEPAVRCDG